MPEEIKGEAVDTVKTAPEIEETGTKPTKPEFSNEQQKYIDELINKQYSKLQAKADEKLKALEQAEKLKSMSEVERQKEEYKILQEKLAVYEKEKLVNQFKVELTTKGLEADMAEFIQVQDADNAKKAVDYFSAYKAKLEKSYADKIKDLEEKVRNLSLRGNTPLATANTLEVKRQNPTII